MKLLLKTHGFIPFTDAYPFESKETAMARTAQENFEKLVQHNVALRDALIAAYGTPAAASLLGHAAVSAGLSVTAEQIDELLEKIIAPALPMSLNELDGIAAGYDPTQDPSQTDRYWSPADLPLGSTLGTKGYQGKSNAPTSQAQLKQAETQVGLTQEAQHPKPRQLQSTDLCGSRDVGLRCA